MKHPEDLASSTAKIQGDLQIERFRLLAVTAGLLDKAEWLRNLAWICFRSRSRGALGCWLGTRSPACEGAIYLRDLFVLYLLNDCSVLGARDLGGRHWHSPLWLSSSQPLSQEKERNGSVDANTRISMSWVRFLRSRAWNRVADTSDLFKEGSVREGGKRTWKGSGEGKNVIREHLAFTWSANWRQPCQLPVTLTVLSVLTSSRATCENWAFEMRSVWLRNWNIHLI